MKTFKRFLTEASEMDSVNKVLNNYVNGSMPDPYDNEQDNVKNLFKQLYDVFTNNEINLIILNNKDEQFDGSNIVIDTDKRTHYNLSDTNMKKLPYLLHVEIKKSNDGYYFFSYVKVEPK